jgi:hypothetical protein
MIRLSRYAVRRRGTPALLLVASMPTHGVATTQQPSSAPIAGFTPAHAADGAMPSFAPLHTGLAAQREAGSALRERTTLRGWQERR